MRIAIVNPHQTIELQPDQISTNEDIPSLIVLRTGVLVPPAAERLGTYHDVFCRFFQDGLKFDEDEQQDRPSEANNLKTNGTASHCSKHLRIISFNVMQSEVEPTEYPSQDLLALSSGILITGSACTSFEDLKWINDLIEFCKASIDRFNHLKLIGICFGHQILSRVLGTQTTLNPLGWELGIDQIQLSPLGHLLFDLKTFLPRFQVDFDHLSSPLLNIHSVHRDIVPTLPASTYSIGRTEKCEIQGLVKFESPAEVDKLIAEEEDEKDSVLRRVKMISLQGHPEYDSKIMLDVLDFRTKNGSDFGLIDADVYLSARQSLERFPTHSHHHGPLIAFKFLKVLHII